MEKMGNEEWKNFYTDWEKSKLRQREYCQLKQINYITFREKIYALRKKGLMAPVIPPHQKAKKLKLKNMAKFQEVVVSDAKAEKTAYCEIKFGETLGETHSIKISSQESLISLRRMLQCLTQA